MKGADLGESLPGNGKNICKSSEQEKCGKFKNLKTSSVAPGRRRIMVRGEVTRRKTGSIQFLLFISFHIVLINVCFFYIS